VSSRLDKKPAQNSQAGHGQLPGRLLTAREVADRYGHCPDTILRWYRAGAMEGIAFKTPGGKVRFREDRLDTWEEQRATQRRGVLPTTPHAARSQTVLSTVLPTTDDEEDQHAT
jgi:excisionase family DNA binding protein